MRLRRIGASVLVVLTAGAALAACGNDGTDKASAVKPAHGHEAVTREVTITVKEHGTDSFMFENVPATLQAGVVRIRLDNSTGKQPHDIQLARLEPGHTLAELTKQVSSEDVPFPAWLQQGTGVGMAAPGQTTEATVKLTEGTWAYFCTQDTEAQNGPPVPHATHGMAGTFEVKGNADGAMPTAAATITATEYKFDAQGLKAGENVVEFRNDGGMFHHVLAFPISPGKTFADVQKAFQSDDQNAPPPFDYSKGIGTAVVGPHESLVTTFDLPAGDYVLVCYMPDPGTAGPPHVVKGMLQELKLG
jgi:uncharacterized cupredoxin-like copper-binding protein